MHLSLSSEMHSFDIKDYKRETFLPIISEAENLDQKIITLFKASNDIDSDIADTANQGEYDLLLIGLGQSIFEGTLLGKVLGFTTRIINPDRLIDKFTGKEGCLKTLLLMKEQDRLLPKVKCLSEFLSTKNWKKSIGFLCLYSTMRMPF